MIRLTFSYIVLLAVVTWLADTGELRDILRQLHAVPWGDKMLHFTLVGTLALLVNLSIRTIWRWPLWPSVVPGTLLVTIAATAEECSNIVVVARNWSPADLAANYLGIVCVGIVPMLVLHNMGRSETEAGVELTRPTMVADS